MPAFFSSSSRMMLSRPSLDYLFIGAGPAQCVGVVGLVEDEALGGILLVAVDHPAGLPWEHVQIELWGGLPFQYGTTC